MAHACYCRQTGARATPHADLHWCQHLQLGIHIFQGLQGMRWAEYDRVCKSQDDGLQDRVLSWWLRKATCDLAALEPVPDQTSQEVLAGLHLLAAQIGFSSNESRSAGSFGDFPTVSGQTRNSTASPQRSCRPLAGWPTESPQRADSPRSGAVTAPLSRRARARHHSLSNHGFPGVVLPAPRLVPSNVIRERGIEEHKHKMWGWLLGKRDRNLATFFCLAASF